MRRPDIYERICDGGVIPPCDAVELEAPLNGDVFYERRMTAESVKRLVEFLRRSDPRRSGFHLRKQPGTGKRMRSDGDWHGVVSRKIDPTFRREGKREI